MISGCSRNATQRSTSASSRSSIRSKWRFATPSLLKGHSLSEGCSSGECEGRNSRCIPSGTLNLLAVCHPARSTTSRMRFLLPAPTSLAKLSSANENTSALTVGRMSQQTSPQTSPVFGRARKRKGVGPLVMLVDLDKRPLTDRTPRLAGDRFEAQTVLLLTPQLYLRRWISFFELRFFELRHPHGEPFLKASCSFSSAFW